LTEARAISSQSSKQLKAPLNKSESTGETSFKKFNDKSTVKDEKRHLEDSIIMGPKKKRPKINCELLKNFGNYDQIY